MSKTTARTDRFDSAWDALADSTEDAANLKMRADLMRKIAALIHDKSWTQAVAAEHCGISQPRINDLLRGRIGRFSLDALVNIAAILGQRVHVELEAA
ncbi:XRE family transcriptional regulator [Lysobacter sp. H23M47]|nr:XRE family transcriptional regulator [Lysobacter sp. H23M47]